MSAVVDVPFLVVGAGPTGMTAAQLLSAAGRRCLVVERRTGTQPNPSAHVVNARTLEIFRQAGFDMPAIQTIAKDPADAGHVNFVTRLGGELIGRLPFERQGADCLDHTPTPLRNISQHRLEPVMATQIGAAPGVELRYGTEWVSASQDADGVTSVVRDVATGDETTVRSSYVLAADGAGSSVRKSLGIAMIGPASLQDFVAIHVLANLRPYVADRPGVLHFVMDPAVGGTFIAHDLDREWVFMVPFDPTTQAIDDFDVEHCIQLLRTAIGDETPVEVPVEVPVEDPLEVVRAGAWHMTAQVAERLADGRVFLVGDAAHRFPPTGGMGLNTGVADAHNLVWKLCAVDDGWAEPTLLDTYQVERLPIAHVNCDQSMTNAFKMVLLAEALDLHPGATSDDLAAVLADPTRRASIDAAVQEQATHFDMLGLQLGYVYADGALVRTGEPPAPISDPSHFEPTADVGARLPHGWLGDGRSTLDLVSTTSMTLVSTGSHEAWAAASASVSASTQVAITHVGLGDDVEVEPRWHAIGRLGAGGALLVRPDQHIAWRADTIPDSPTDALEQALARVVGRAAT